MPALAKVAREKLQALTLQGRKRELTVTERMESCVVTREGKQGISFSCNDYLGLSQDARVKKTAKDATELYGSGAGASRLVTGNYPAFTELEDKLAKWKGCESALVLGSGYLANIGVIPALVDKDDLILADKLVHASLIDGALLSKAKLLRFAHNNMQDCERLLTLHRSSYQNCLIVTDEVFSMDGDIAPLAELNHLAKSYDSWLMVDGAHALTPSEYGDINIGTLSKAFGSYGGYVCASRDIIDYLITSLRSFVFSTGLPPAVIAASIASIDIMLSAPELLLQPVKKAQLFTKTLGLPLAQSPIVPIILGNETKALAASRTLWEEGYLVTAIRPPTVPIGTSRLRFTFCTMHEDKDILKLADIIKSKGWL
jgi:8-amino-7-oxononanoate synthase